MTLDPALFRPEAIDPETAAFVTELEQMLAAFPSILTQTAAEVRAARAEGRGGAASPPFPAGGWALGSAREQDPRLEALADACNVAVLSVEYRLAPEDPYPAGPDDCEAAALWLAEKARTAVR